MAEPFSDPLIDSGMFPVPEDVVYQEVPLVPLRPFDGADDPSLGAHSLGLSLLLVGIGAVSGIIVGGPLGGVAGSLYGGSAANAVRAARSLMKGDPAADKEAILSGTYAVLGAGLGTYMAYRIHESKHEKRGHAT